MILPDVNVLVYAHRLEAPEHAAYARWLQATVTGAEPFALSEPVMSGFLRVVTHRKVFRTPTPLERALEFLDELAAQPGCRLVRPGARHWGIFLALCRASGAADKLIADAFHAAIAIEHGCEWVSADADFGRFAGLRWSHPLRR